MTMDTSLRFGGWQKHSLIDYPGKIACVLFMEHCNFACPYCHNPELATGRVPEDSKLDLETVFDLLAARRSFLEGVVITGGEPTLSRHLPALCLALKTMGYPVKLDTNGSRPAVLASLLNAGLVDYVAMDVKTDPQYYPKFICSDNYAEAVVDSIRLIMNAGVDYEFRTTVVYPLVDETVIGAIAKAIAGAKRYVLQAFKPERLLSPAFFSSHPRQPDPASLDELSRIARPWVGECLVR